jgi:hypothetical protein
MVWQARRGLVGGWNSEVRGAAPWPETPWKNARLGVKYVGDAACARCHQDIADTFRRHPMGRSLAPIAAAPAAARGMSDGVTRFEAGPSEFVIERRDGREIHRETRRDEQGRILASVEAEASYVLGSGRRGFSYLIERDDRLYQSPISWYGQQQRWDLSPGYERFNYHFDRPIEPQCMFCHANQVEPIELSVNRYRQPIFRGHSVGCERCHGPGELHVRGQQEVDGKDVTIVNPRHLEPSLRGAVCEQCHLLGDHRIERPGREPFDYRPGLPTTAFFAVYESTDKEGTKAVGHVEQMKVSVCYLASQGRLGCTSCHDPHQVPSPEERLAYFRQRCLDCHERRGCSLPDLKRLARSPKDNCMECHMPIASNTDIAHTAVTDHRILRSPRGHAAAPPVPAHAHANAPLRLLNGDGLHPRELESLGRELGMALTFEGDRLRKTPRARQLGYLSLAFLDRALAERPDDPAARRMRARALALAGRLREAIQLDQRVLESAPSYEQVLEGIISYAIELGDIEAALAPARQAVAVNPWSAAFHERLAYVDLRREDWSEALRESREALRLNPFLRFAREFLIQCLLHQHDERGAEAEFQTLIKLNPNERESLGRWFADQLKARR